MFSQRDGDKWFRNVITVVAGIVLFFACLGFLLGYVFFG